MRKPSSHAGYTLIELLVAMAIVAVILIVTAQITGSARDSVRWAEKKIAADSGARQLTSLLERDLREMIRRPDAPFEFKVESGNDTLAFLATRAGYAKDSAVAHRGVSLVRYGTDAAGHLVRGCLGFGFEGDDGVPLDPAVTLPEIPDDNRQIVSDTVFRVEFEFLVDEGKGPLRQQDAPVKLADLRGIVTSVAALDLPSRARLKAGDLSQLTGLLDDASDSLTPAVVWSESVEHHAGRGLPGIPGDVFRAIRIYEQTVLFD